MAYLITKYVVTAFIIVIVSEIAKRSDKMGALISSLPIVTMMVMIWLYLENQSTEKIANHSFYTFYYVIPTLPMFILMPMLLKQGINFYISLLSGAILTFICFGLTAWICKHFGIDLF